MKRLIIPVAILGTLSACAPANISAVIRPSDRENASMETRCEKLDMRDSEEMKSVFAKYDGWRMIYASEYTTGNRIGTQGAVCFERPKTNK